MSDVPSPFLPRTTLPPSVDVCSIVPELKEFEKKTIRLHPRRLTIEQALAERVDSSKVGGVFAWPCSSPLPCCPEHGDEMVPVLQLRKDDVLEHSSLFPEPYDLLQVWWCPRDHDGYCPIHTAKWWTLSELMCCELNKGEEMIKYLDRQEGEGISSDYIPTPCTLHPEMVTEYPHAFELSDNYPLIWDKIKNNDEMNAVCDLHPEWQIRNASCLYQYHLSVAPGFKFGTYKVIIVV